MGTEVKVPMPFLFPDPNLFIHAEFGNSGGTNISFQNNEKVLMESGDPSDGRSLECRLCIVQQR